MASVSCGAGSCTCDGTGQSAAAAPAGSPPWVPRFPGAGSVRSLVPSVLLRMRGRDALRRNIQFHPPHRKSRQPGNGAGSKRRTVVGANRLRHSVLPKRGFEPSREREHASVRGSMRVLSCVRLQPLKSPHQMRFGPWAAANGAVCASTRRRFLRPTTFPAQQPHHGARCRPADLRLRHTDS
jgi:hypothetical protein